MSEKLVIKNFGPIKDVELELGRFNVLIGEQATGKSTVAKLLIAIQNTAFRDLFDIPEDISNRETQLFFGHANLVGIENYFSNNTEISYSNHLFSFNYKNQTANIEKQREFTIQEKTFYDFNYIPAERILIPTIADSLFALIETQTSLPKLFLRFGDKFIKARKNKKTFDYKNIIGITYTHKENKDIIILPNGKEVPILESSSGFQACVTLLTVFDSIVSYYSTANSSYQSVLKTVTKFLVIEEPELNCFPKTQYKLIKYLIENITKWDIDEIQYKNQLLLTTHSPYILTSLNNLMYAYKIGQTHKEEANKIIEEKYWVNPDDVSAYQLLSDGTCKNILDRDESLIEADKIDEVSRTINKEFDELMNIEFVTK